MRIVQVLFLLGAIPTVGGIAVLVMLAPPPRFVIDHLEGLARYLMLAGTTFGAARVLMGWCPSVEVTVLVLGLGLGMGIYAREHNLIARAQDRFDDSSQESGV
ncbi:MAG: hypothetical protein RL254_1230 [Planctomycetota bacterium]|jgi:hypothetical protein